MPVIELTLEMTAAAAYPLTVVVKKGGKVVEDANVIVISKAIPLPSFYTSKTDATGRAIFYIPDGTYLIIADDGTNYRAFRDEVAYTSKKPTLVELYLVEKKTARYYVKLIFTVDIAPYLRPIIDALARISDKFLELSGAILTPLGITIPAVELARHFEVEKVESNKNEITIWFKYIGSSIPQGVVIALIALAIVVIIFVVSPFILKWLFGEEAIVAIEYVAIAIGLAAVASIIASIVGLVKRS